MKSAAWPARIELPFVLGLAALTAAWASVTQTFQVFRYWDADEYFLMAEQLAAGETITAAAPYAYRLLTPAIVAQCCAADIQRGFLLVNLASGMALAVLLTWWLRRFVASPAIRVAVVSMSVLQWHAPIRLAFYYPVYVDPLFQVCVVAALLAGERWLAQPSTARGLAYVALVAVGTLARETMLVVPACALFAALWRRDGSGWRAAWPAAALAAGVAAFAVAGALTNPRGGYGFADAVALHLANKPIESILLVWFIAFGPIVAVVLYDWRATLAFLRRRVDLALLPVLCVGLAYVGGHDTERYLFWSMPVVYLLIAQSMERHIALIASTAVAATLVVGQVLSERVLWPVPDPGRAVTALGEETGWPARLYAIANRVFVIDDFHWNLWSNFGSRPFHLVQLAFYGALAALVIVLMRRRAAAAVPR